MARLDGKVAIVTGAAGGIGSATARRFVEEGARVLLVDVKEGLLNELAARFGDRAASVVADVSDPSDSERYVQEAVKRFGGIDILFANAGTEGTVKPLTEAAPEEFDRVLGINVRGVWLSIKYSAKEIARRGGGSIIVTSSIAGVKGFAGLGPYVTSKHAVVGLTKAAAIELGPLKIRVNSINPGPIDNSMMRSVEQQANSAAPESVKAGFEAQIPLGRYGTNEEIANLALFLASDESSYCTGATLLADGGMAVA